MTNQSLKHPVPDRWRRPLAALSALGLAAFAPGCANTSHMALYQNTVLGVNGAVNPDNSNVHLKVGFSRDFITVIPKVKREDGEMQAGSVFATSRTNVKGLNIPEVDEVIITGDAAARFAKTKDGHEVFNPGNGSAE